VNNCPPSLLPEHAGGRLARQRQNLMEKWLASEDKDIRWVTHENLKKNRLMKADLAWSTVCQDK
jgi:hypothetical protein